MNELEEKFLKETAEPIFENYKKEVMLKLLDNEEKLKIQILSVLQNIANKAKKRENYKVKYIDFSLLQIEFLKEKYEVTAIAYDENWYASDGIWEIFSVDYIFEELKDIKEKLYRDIKKYVGKIRLSCIDQYILKQLSTYNIYLSYFVIKSLKQWDEEASFKEMPKAEELQIIWGEYKNCSQKVYYYDSNPKTEKLFKELIQRGKQEETVFSSWTGIKVDTVKIENKDISCMNLKESELKEIFFLSSTAVGLNFKKANLKKCYFRNCDLGASDFSESNLEEVVFENCILRNISFRDAKFKDVYLSDGKTFNEILKEEDLYKKI
ncbi:pentapeptide repeat-containing protein [Clostridium sp.]|uniref:pentapeptide repeat-containing protein n=1 Tax=Clostridium sp. TaxID=1506 RepID=UPI002609BA18|nr:pentapeptide repeat-containing protein [Clostridium sp.]